VVTAGDDVLDERLDAVPRQPGFGAVRVTVHELQQHVDEVPRNELLAGAGHPRLVLVEDLLVKPIERLSERLHPPVVPLHVDPPEPGEPLPDVADRAGHGERLVERAPERLALGAAGPLLPNRHAEDVPQRQARQVLPHVDRLSRASAAEQAAGEDAHLLSADALELVHAARGEELGGAELARHAPVGPVRGVHDAEVAVGGDLAGGCARAVGEGEVVGLEHEPGRVGGGGHHHVVRAEPEVHELAVARRERGQRAQAADHGPAMRAWQKVPPPSLGRND
jgi:hypothetical protein